MTDYVEFMLDDEQMEVIADDYSATRFDYDSEIEKEFQNLYRD